MKITLIILKYEVNRIFLLSLYFEAVASKKALIDTPQNVYFVRNSYINIAIKSTATSKAGVTMLPSIITSDRISQTPVQVGLYNLYIVSYHNIVHYHLSILIFGHTFIIKIVDWH